MLACSVTLLIISYTENTLVLNFHIGGRPQQIATHDFEEDFEIDEVCKIILSVCAYCFDTLSATHT